MSSAREIFDSLMDLDPTRREAQLHKLCGDDAQLRGEVQSLLQAHEDAGQFFGEPTLDPGVTTPPRNPNVTTPPGDSGGVVSRGGNAAEVSVQEGPGDVVDRYKLLERIGEGGFGIVYMAQQSKPIRRRVALKIIKLGMDTHQVVARFEAERQALALMDHPNIARVIDGGSTSTGRPYFVMELVRGDPITQFCDQKRLPLKGRLELFQQVCRAIEHAHQKGIIHRDIKPSNVLVTIADDLPMVKVIDFGIAKATRAELTEKTLFTEFRQLLGTPLYMSPEQAERSGVDIDTRSDVYSLGVLLYEILTGRTPLDPKRLNSAAWGELQRMIVDEEPSRPSVMITSSLAADLSEIAKRRGIQPTKLGQLLRGDLDWIVLKAIDKDRTRRYGTASQFADDIGRFLNDENVEATPPSRRYQWRKFAKRNRGWLVTASLVFAALLVGLVGTSVTAAWAIRSQRAAEAALARAQAGETLAGASRMLPEPEARRMAARWAAEIDTLAIQSEQNPAAIATERAKYITWFATWLSEHGNVDEARGLIDQGYADAKQYLGVSDPTFLALCNRSILVDEAAEADPIVIASHYDDLMESLAAIHGESKVLPMLPEQAAALARAKRFDDATEVVSRYLTFRAKDTIPLSAAENMRLDLAIDRMTNWGSSHPELIRQLRSVRETGKVTDAVATPENDDMLATDLESLQGKWRGKLWKGRDLVEHQILDINGDECETRWIDEDGKTIRGRVTRIELSRSGSAKVFTASLPGDPAPGGAFIYDLKPHQFIIVSGMLQNRPSLPGIDIRRYYRMKPGEADDGSIQAVAP